MLFFSIWCSSYICGTILDERDKRDYSHCTELDILYHMCCVDNLCWRTISPRGYRLPSASTGTDTANQICLKFTVPKWYNWLKLNQPILAILFRPVGFIAHKTSNYMAFQSFIFERIWWRVFQKRVVRAKFDIYAFIRLKRKQHHSIIRSDTLQELLGFNMSYFRLSRHYSSDYTKWLFVYLYLLTQLIFLVPMWKLQMVKYERFN